MLRRARDKDMNISFIFYVDGAGFGVDPFGKNRMGQEDMLTFKRHSILRTQITEMFSASAIPFM